MTLHFKLLGPNDAAVLDRVAAEVFDNPINPTFTAEFLRDPRHHMVVALEEDVVVGMASGLHYLHPDKAPELFINEVGVAATHRRQGIARQLVEKLLAHGRSLGCTGAWVGTELTNAPARQLYHSTGGREDEPFVLYWYDFDEQ